ncbi:MAG: glycoside hydrolase family 20 zincin-like fold domain-containing protein, partial [Phycisphaerae bacterium]
MPTVHLIPQPQELTFKTGFFKVPSLGWIVLEDSPAARDHFVGQRLARQLETATATPWKVVRSGRPETDPSAQQQLGEGEIRCVADSAIMHDQGYRLIIHP